MKIIAIENFVVLRKKNLRKKNLHKKNLRKKNLRKKNLRKAIENDFNFQCWCTSECDCDHVQYSSFCKKIKKGKYMVSIVYYMK